MAFKKGKTIPKASETLVLGIVLLFFGTLFLCGGIADIALRGYIYWLDYCIIGASFVALFFGVLALNAHKKGFTRFEK